MRKYLLALLLVSGTALADLNNATAVSGSNAISASGANSAATQGNSQAITVTSPGTVDYQGSYTLKNVPSISMGNVFPTSPCSGASSVGAAGVGFGLSFGTSWTDRDCSFRETARSFATLGLIGDAVKVLCASEFAAAAPSCAGATPLPANTAPQPPECYRDELVARRVGKPVCQ